MLKARSQALIAGAISAAMFAGAGQAQQDAGVPDFSGLWGRDSLNLESPLSGPGPIVNLSHTQAGTMDMNRLVGDYNSPILKPQAAAILKERGERSLRGESVPNPHELCRPEPPPLLFAVQFAFEMLQQKNEVTLLYSHDNKVRHVRMNVPHPADLMPSGQGDSVGHYEGDTLVIDTIGIKPAAMSFVDPFGTPHTDKLHVVERYRVITDGKGKGLEASFRVEDPGAFTMPWVATVTYRPNRAQALEEVICAENNIGFAGEQFGPTPEEKTPQF